MTIFGKYEAFWIESIFLFVKMYVTVNRLKFKEHLEVLPENVNPFSKIGISKNDHFDSLYTV